MHVTDHVIQRVQLKTRTPENHIATRYPPFPVNHQNTTALNARGKDLRMYHLSAREGIMTCIHRVFEEVACREQAQTILYVNNSTPGPLRKAISESRQAWTNDPEKLKNFHYERVNSLDALLALLAQQFDLVIIEHLDHIASEPTDDDYATRNRKLADVMTQGQNAIFIDDWDFLQRYYQFLKLEI